MRECDYIAWVPGMEEEFATTWGRTPEEARADMFERIDEIAEEGGCSPMNGEQFEDLIGQVAANANLIAAAPDLYVALEDLADIIETLCKWLDVAHGLAGGAIEGAYREACAGSLDRAATALAKARGEEVAR